MTKKNADLLQTVILPIGEQQIIQILQNQNNKADIDQLVAVAEKIEESSHRNQPKKKSVDDAFGDKYSSVISSSKLTWKKLLKKMSCEDVFI